MAASVKDVEPTELWKGAKRWVLAVGKNVSLAIVEIDPKIAAPHPVLKHDHEEIIYILGGTNKLEYPELGKEWIMKTGSAKLHDIGVGHKGGPVGDEKLYVLEVRAPPPKEIEVKWREKKS